jgi:hypothetical protein
VLFEEGDSCLMPAYIPGHALILTQAVFLLRKTGEMGVENAQNKKMNNFIFKKITICS